MFLLLSYVISISWSNKYRACLWTQINDKEYRQKPDFIRYNKLSNNKNLTKKLKEKLNHTVQQ